MGQMAEVKESAASVADLTKMVADGIAEGMARHVPKKVTVGEYLKKHAKKEKLTRACYQNGRPVENELLTDEETRLLNGIHRPGRYLDRKVEVIIRPEPDNVLEIRYSDKRIDQRIELAHYFRSFKEMLEKITAEQKTANDEEKAREARR